MRTANEKEAIINSRGQSSSAGTGNAAYTVRFKNGKKCSLLCMNNETLEEASESCVGMFGDKFSHIESGKTYEELKSDRL